MISTWRRCLAHGSQQRRFAEGQRVTKVHCLSRLKAQLYGAVSVRATAEACNNYIFSDAHKKRVGGRVPKKRPRGDG